MMNKRQLLEQLVLGALFFLTVSSHAAGIPTQMTYQGTLKEKGIPITAVKDMTFQITGTRRFSPQTTR